MTSFAFLLGTLPLVLATGAGANARASIGLAVFTGMLASTCIAVLFVPSFFVMTQRLEEWLAGRKQAKPRPPSPDQALKRRENGASHNFDAALAMLCVPPQHSVSI
jgi:uncharacterized membrane protein YhiD involved in acid resistance